MPSITAAPSSPASVIHITVSPGGPSWPALVIAVLGVVLAIMSLGWQFFTWRGSGSRVRVETGFAIFPAQQMSQLMDKLNQAVLPPDFAHVAPLMSQQLDQLMLPPDLSYSPVAAGLMAVLPRESIMIVATIRNSGRLPVTILRCQWQTAHPWIIESPNNPPGASFPYRLGEHDRCISVIDLATIVSVLDAPHRDMSKTGREVWPIVEVAHKRKPVRGRPLTIPSSDQPPLVPADP